MVYNGIEIEDEPSDMSWKSDGSVSELFEPQSMNLDSLFLLMNMFLNYHVSSWIHTSVDIIQTILSLFQHVLIFVWLLEWCVLLKMALKFKLNYFPFCYLVEMDEDIDISHFYFDSSILLKGGWLWERWTVVNVLNKDSFLWKYVVSLVHQEQHQFQ